MGSDKKNNLILLMMAAWLAILGTFAFWFEINVRQNEWDLAMSTAKTLFQQNLVSRKWNAHHGGVYVPITTETQPNPYLPEHLRVLTTDNGMKLTRINPAYMTRQMAEMMAKEVGGTKFHLTSLNPIRPENKAADWEKRWLKSFEQGSKEQGEFFDDGTTTWFRYMAPLIAEPECLNCHALQGYKKGDIRGGLSVSRPYPAHTPLHLLIGFGSVAITGLIFIFIGNILYERKHRLFDATFNSPVPTCITGKDYTILLANEAYWTKFGALPDHQKTIKCYEHRPGKFCHTENCPLARIMDGASKYACESIKENDGVSKHFIITAKPLLNSRGKVLGCVESFQDISKRKLAEKALAESNRSLEALSITDGLTGIANRRRFDMVLAKEHDRHARSGGELSLIMLDIDFFKLFNDSHGHVKGDECLRQVAEVMAAYVARPADLVARYGGEEFACILPETGSNGAVAIAEEIRRGIIALAIPHKESNVADCVTASLGVVTVQCTAEDSGVDIVAQADEQLYLAKSAGRNRVKFAATRKDGGKIKGSLARLVWEDSFSCGNQLIDSQHQALFGISNKLLEAVLSARPAEEISATINQLLAEVSQHFHDEEIILKAINFPGLNQHAGEHAELLAKGLTLAQEFKASTLTVGDVFQFLAYEVIMIHMLKVDREYFPFINEAGAAVTGTGKTT